MSTYGKWPLITSNWSESDFDWRKASAAVTSTFDIGFLFEVSNFLDANNTSKHAIYVLFFIFHYTAFIFIRFLYAQLDQPELGIPAKVINGKSSEFLRTAYEIFMYRVVKEFRRATNFGVANNTLESDRNITTYETDESSIDDTISYFFEKDELLLQEISDTVDFQAKLADVHSSFLPL